MIDDFKPSILYVEDENNLRDELARFIKRFASDFYIATNGEEGFEKYKKYKPDLVVTDIKMPFVDGIELCNKIKEVEKRQHIIFTTAHSDSSYLLSAIEAHVDGYILKPVDLDLFEIKLKNVTEDILFKKRCAQLEIELKRYIENKV
jgi:YesN/AraC family two-component response regulator